MSDQLALARRAVACKHWKWMTGMQVRVCDMANGHVSVARMVGTTVACWASSVVEDVDHSELLPDLNDAATLGCLLALVREAWTDQGISCVIGSYRNGIYYWRVVDGRHQGSDFYAMSQIMRLTEAEALVVALEAAP